MKNLENLYALLVKIGGRHSKTKVTLLAAAILDLAQVFGWTHFTPEELVAVNGALAAIAGIFFRQGVG